ncbi:MAG TPA: TonB-dependent receptor [Pyrinomonadaceae bacterium]|jgi:outer membrane receptor protein involved in Fe transport
MMRNFPPALARLLVWCACILLTTSAAFAQSQATTGNIEGRVLDPNNAVMPGINVTATNAATGFEKSATTDDEGNYRLILLPPGSYNVKTSATTGFQPTTLTNVQVTVGGKTPLDIQMALAGADTITINVEADGQVVETTRTSVSSTVNQRAIENLPVSGRNYLDFATLTPAVVRDPTRVGDLSVGGQKGTLNNLQVDGVDNNNSFFGQAFGRTGVRPPYQFSEESVQEFQVNQNGFSAEFGRAGGSLTNAITKSGTNEFHGSLFEYFRDESLNANAPNLIASTTPTGQPRPNKRAPSQINQYGGVLGGPIVKNRAFFFFIYDGQRTNFTNVLEPPAIPLALQSTLGSRLSPYAVNRDQDVYMVKVDTSINHNNQLTLRFNRQNFTGVNNEFTGSLAAEEHSGDSLARTTTFSGTLASTLTPRVVNEFRFQFARDAEPGEANSTDPEAQIRTDFGTLFIGRNNFSPRETTIRRAQFVNNLSYVRGAHVAKVGVDFLFDRILNFFPGSFGGIYGFNSLADFAANRPSSFTQRFAGAGTSGATTHPNSEDYAAYIQDDWRATPKLTINAGLRYDNQHMKRPPIKNTDPVLLAAGIDTGRPPQDDNNIAPRLGFSYAFSERTVVRGGYGIFYGRTTGIMLGTAHSGNGIQTNGITLSSTAAIAAAGLVYPNVLTALPPGANTGRPDLFLFADNYEQPYVQQGRLGFEHEILPNTSISATYLFYKGVHLSRTRDINLFQPTEVTVTESGTSNTFTFTRFPGTGATATARFTSTTPLRPFANYNRINLFEGTGNSRYDALAIEAKRRFSGHFQFSAAYTFSRARDDRPDQTAVVPGGGDDAKIVQNQFNIREDYGISDVDLPHRFVFSPVYITGRFTHSDNGFVRALLSDYVFSGIAQLQSGFPYSATLGFDLNRDGNSRNDRLPGTARNEFRTPATYQFDARITRIIRLRESMRLRLILEGFNIFNRANVALVNTNFLTGATFNANGTFTLRRPAASAAFGTPRSFLTSVASANRELQLAIKFDF